MIQEIENIASEYKQTLELDVKSLISLYKKDKKTPGRSGKWLKAVNRSAIVLMAANTENYIETIVCAGLGYLFKNKVKARQYPENFRIWIFNEKLSEYNVSKGKTKDIIELSMKLWSDVRELEKSEMLLDAIKERFSNPTPKNVNWIMNLLGKENYTNNLIIKLDRKPVQVKGMLQNLARRRNRIAHGDINESPNIDEIIKFNKFCKLFANQIKKDVEASIINCLK